MLLYLKTRNYLTEDINMKKDTASSKKSAQKPSYLDSFFMEKIKNYQEPQRKGTPKGEPIGLSTQKYYAALLMLKDVPIKELSKSVRVSYGLLRKWRTEKPFKEQIAQLESVFMNELITHLGWRGEMQKKLSDDYFEKSIDYIATNPPPELTWNEFRDLIHYSPHLIASIVIVVPKALEDFLKRVNEIFSNSSLEWSDEDLSLVATYQQYVGFFGLLKYYPFRKSSKKDKYRILEEVKARTDKWEDAYYKMSLNILNRDSGSISEYEQKRVIHSLHYMAGKFTPVDM